jgi:hypothetical protein
VGVIVPSVLNARLWEILGTGAATPTLIKQGNWINTAEPQYWLRERSRKAPNDFPRLKIEVGVSGSHSGFAKDETFAVERTDFLDGTDDWEIERVEDVLITIRQRGELADGVNPLREAVIDDIMRAGPRLQIPDPVYRLGRPGAGIVYTHRQRDTRGDENPQPGTVTEIRFTIICLEMGRASLAP